MSALSPPSARLHPPSSDTPFLPPSESSLSQPYEASLPPPSVAWPPSPSSYPVWPYVAGQPLWERRRWSPCPPGQNSGISNIERCTNWNKKFEFRSLVGSMLLWRWHGATSASPAVPRCSTPPRHDGASVTARSRPRLAPPPRLVSASLPHPSLSPSSLPPIPESRLPERPLVRLRALAPDRPPVRNPRPVPGAAAPLPRHDQPAAGSGPGGGGRPRRWRR